MFAKDMGNWFRQVWGKPRTYTNPNKYTPKNGVVYQSGFSGGVTGHVDVVYRRRWASIYLRDVIGAPNNNFRTEVFH